MKKPLFSGPADRIFFLSEIWTFSMSELARCMSAIIFVFSTVSPWITGLGSAYLVTQILRTLSGARASGILIMAAN